MTKILQQIPQRQYTKTEICQVLIDPHKFLSGNAHQIKKITRNDTHRLKQDILKSGLLNLFGITEAEYDTCKYLRASWCELIFEKLM